MPGKILYQYHTDEYGADFKTPVGKIIPTNKPGFIGLYNATGKAIKFSKDGKTGICQNEGRMPLLAGMTINIDRLKIEVK